MKQIYQSRRMPPWVKIALWGLLVIILVALVFGIPYIIDELNSSLYRTLTQSGVITVSTNSNYDVYYHTPYLDQHQPELTFPPTNNVSKRLGYEIIEQRPDGFRVKIHSWSDLKTNAISWKVSGPEPR